MPDRTDRFCCNPRRWRHTAIGYGHLVLMITALGLAACSTRQPEPESRYSQKNDSAPAAPVDVSSIPDAIPRAESRSRWGNPDSYEVLGKRYHTLDSSEGYKVRGIASWYGTKFHGHRTSSGETYDMYKMTAAHKSLPLPTYARVTNLDNGKTVVVKINDRGPFHENRVMDLSYAAAARLGILQHGTGLVEIQTITPDDSGNKVVRRDEKAPVTASLATLDAAAPGKTGPTLYLQVGAFASRGNAERLKHRLLESFPGEKTRIHEAENSSGRFYRVRIGPLENVESADQISASLRQQGLENPQVVVD